MGVAHFTRPPLFRRSQNPAPSIPVVKPAKANGGFVSSEGKSLTEKAALKWFSKLDGSKRMGPPLLITHYRTFGCSCETGTSNEVFLQQSVRERCLVSKVAQKLTKFGFKSLNKQESHLLNCDFQKPETSYTYTQNKLQLESRCKGSGKSLSQRDHEASRRLAVPQVVANGITKSSGDDDKSNRRKPLDNVGVTPQDKVGWLSYAVATVTIVSATAAVKGIQSSSAHAAAGDGGYGLPPPGSGDGGGGGGGGSGGSDAGNGERFFGNVIDSRKQDEEPPKTVNVKKVISEKASVEAKETTSPKRVKALASLSSAAGNVMDGEAPVGGGLVRGFTPTEEVDHFTTHPGPYSAAKPFDVSREDSREPFVRKYDPSNPFPAGDSRPIQGRSFSPGTDYREGANRGRDQPSAGRNIAFDSMPPPSGKPKLHNNYEQGNEISNAPRVSNDFYTHATDSDTHSVSREFSSIRGKITQIPGFVQEGGKFQAQGPQSVGTDFSGWVGGLVHAIVGKRTGGAESGSRDQSVEDRKALVTEVVTRALQLIGDQASEAGLAKSSETGALRRLQRETFSDLLKVRERLDKLEHHSGLKGPKSYGNALSGVKTMLKGEVNSGGAFVVVEDLTSNLSRFSLQHAGMQTGLDVKFTFETPMRENDLLTTQCGVGQVSGENDSSFLGGPINLQKINYMAQINDNLSLSVAPLGAKAIDMSDTVNHLQGQALTTLAGSGPALYQHCRGSAIGASLRSNSVLLSMSQFLSGWGSRAADTACRPLCLSTLAQFMVQPSEHMVLSLSAVNNLWPSPPLPSSSGFHWSEMGPMVLCKTITRPTQPTGTFTFNDLPSSSSASFLSQGNVPERDSWSPDAESRAPLGSSGTAMQSVAFSGEIDLGGHVSLGGWAQVERADWLEGLEKKDFQWNLSLAKSTGNNVNWGLSVGCRKRDDWGEDGISSPTSGPIEESSSQLQMEAFAKFKVGLGFTLQPGIVYIIDKYTQTPAFMVRSSWTL